MNESQTLMESRFTHAGHDLVSGLVVFLVALPLCLGVALASNAPLISGLIAGIVGGLVIGGLSGSQTSVSGPAAALTTIVAGQIVSLGSFEAFLMAVVIGGVFQLALGLLKAGELSEFVPSSVIKGLLTAIGVILILKQIPHLLGHDTDPEGDMAFQQPDHENTFSEFLNIFQDAHLGAATIGIVSLIVIVLWAKVKFLKKSPIPAALVVVILGVLLSVLFERIGGSWAIGAGHRVQVPVAKSLAGFAGLLSRPDFSQWTNPAVYSAGLTIAVVASLATLLNLEAVDRLDPKQRHSPPNRELMAQGAGNIVAGLLGGIPLTSVIVRGSVNIAAGARTRLSTIVHGLLLAVCVIALPAYLNQIPLACLAAILLAVGFKLASPKLIRQMWNEGRYQFLPFAATVLIIVLTDLLTGILVGLALSSAFILNSNLRQPLHWVKEKHLGEDVVYLELANQVSFLNRAALERTLREVPPGGHVLLDADGSDYIDPDILSLIRDFKEQIGPAKGIHVSLRGFRSKYRLAEEIHFADYSTRELQERMTPRQALEILQEGNERFRSGRRLPRDFNRQIYATSRGQHPMAVVLSCIDSRTPAELILDLGLGDVFSVRVAGNVISPKVLGSIEYGCAVAGAKLVLVLGHTKCGAVGAAVSQVGSPPPADPPDANLDCRHVQSILTDIEESIDEPACKQAMAGAEDEQLKYIDRVAAKNVERSVREILEQSPTIKHLTDIGQVAVVGGMYDVATGLITFEEASAVGL